MDNLMNNPFEQSHESIARPCLGSCVYTRVANSNICAGNCVACFAACCSTASCTDQVLPSICLSLDWLQTLVRITAPQHTCVCVLFTGPGREILVSGFQALAANRPDMNSLVGLGATASFGVSCVAALMPHLRWKTFFEEPAMLLGEPTAAVWSPCLCTLYGCAVRLCSIPVAEASTVCVRVCTATS